MFSLFWWRDGNRLGLRFTLSFVSKCGFRTTWHLLHDWCCGRVGQLQTNEFLGTLNEMNVTFFCGCNMVLFHECLIHILDFFVVPWDILRSSFRCFFRNAVLVGFLVDSTSCCRGAVNSFPTPGMLISMALFAMDLGRMFAIKLVWSVCLEIEWNWGNPRNCEIFYKNHGNETHVWSIRIGEVFQFSGPKKKTAKSTDTRLPDSILYGPGPMPLKKTASLHLDPYYGVTLVDIDLFKDLPFSEASTPNPLWRGRPWMSYHDEVLTGHR